MFLRKCGLYACSMAYVDFMAVGEQYCKFKGFYCVHDTCMPVL